MIKIALMGFDLCSPNKGCEALTYSFVSLLTEIIKEPFEAHVYAYSNMGTLPLTFPEINFILHRPHFKNPLYWWRLIQEFNSYDCIFDVTYGDGFSDIYGKLWNVNTDLAKQLANVSKTPLVLLPQTYGPYESVFLKKWAANIVKHATIAMARDGRSAEEMAELGCDDVLVATDLAFALPFDRSKYASLQNIRTKIGVNVSSLLWDGGHQIRLNVDYRKYCRDLISHYIRDSKFEVHLIPHVIDKENPDSLENDSRVCKLLADEYPGAILAPDFDNPVDAKSYISNMDVFIGARMHSTIASMSSGVPTIPFSYSKKFEGLFGNLNYPFVISGKSLETDEAVRLTEQYVVDRSSLRRSVGKSLEGIAPKLEIVKRAVSAALRGEYGKDRSRLN